jgi:hypothetical protein
VLVCFHFSKPNDNRFEHIQKHKLIQGGSYSMKLKIISIADKTDEIEMSASFGEDNLLSLLARTANSSYWTRKH